MTRILKYHRTSWVKRYQHKFSNWFSAHTKSRRWTARKLTEKWTCEKKNSDNSWDSSHIRPFLIRIKHSPRYDRQWKDYDCLWLDCPICRSPEYLSWTFTDLTKQKSINVFFRHQRNLTFCNWKSHDQHRFWLLTKSWKHIVHPTPQQTCYSRLEFLPFWILSPSSQWSFMKIYNDWQITKLDGYVRNLCPKRIVWKQTHWFGRILFLRKILRDAKSLDCWRAKIYWQRSGCKNKQI